MICIFKENHIKYLGKKEKRKNGKHAQNKIKKAKLNVSYFGLTLVLIGLTPFLNWMFHFVF